MQIVSHGHHEPKTEVDVDRTPGIVGSAWSSALGDVVHDLVHGEEKLQDLTPLGEVLTGGGDLKLDVIVDVDLENRVGIGRGWDLGWEN
jgi:hypothetical protein